MTERNFHFCLNEILKWEGGNDDDPRDPGGRTSRGITQHEFNAYLDLAGRRRLDVWHASIDDIQDIYRISYWLPHCPGLAPGLDLMWFNIGVNCGTGEASRLFAKAGAREGTNAKAHDLIETITEELRAHYRALHHPYFQKGWLNRANDVEKVALTMVKGEGNELRSGNESNSPAGDVRPGVRSGP